MQEHLAQAELMARGLCIACACLIALYDVRHFRIPDYLTAFLAVVGLLRVVLLFPERQIEVFLAAVVGGGVFWSLGRIFRHLRGYDGLGLGDVKLVAVMGLWLGMDTALAISVGTTLALTATVALVALKRRSVQDPIPLGTYLAFGWCAVLLLR